MQFIQIKGIKVVGSVSSEMRCAVPPTFCAVPSHSRALPTFYI